MISFCSRRVRLRFSLRFSLQKFTFCVNSKIRKFRFSPQRRDRSPKNPHKKQRRTRVHHVKVWKRAQSAKGKNDVLRALCCYSSSSRADAAISRGFLLLLLLFARRARARAVFGGSLSSPFFFYPDGERSDFAHHSLTLSLSLFSFQRHTHTKTHITVLPAATQTRALERHDGYDLFGRDSVGDDRECVWNARHGVEGFSDRVEQETGLLKEDRKRKRKRKPVVSLDYKI